MEKDRKEANVLLILTIVIVFLIVAIVIGLYLLNQKTSLPNQATNTSSSITTQTLSSETSTSVEAVKDEELTQIQKDATDLVNEIDATLKEADSVDTNRDTAPQL